MYHYMYHYGSPEGMVLPTVYLLIFAGALFVAAVEYIFLGMGLYRMAANRNHPSPWMAFVPFARTYLRGVRRYLSEETLCEKSGTLACAYADCLQRHCQLPVSGVFYVRDIWCECDDKRRC